MTLQQEIQNHDQVPELEQPVSPSTPTATTNADESIQETKMIYESCEELTEKRRVVV